MEVVDIRQIDHQLTWQIRHEVMYPGYPLDKIKLDHEEEGLHFGLFLNEQLISVISLFWNEHVYQFRKFATIATEQGKGYGSMLLQHIIRFSGDQTASILWCNARVSASAFYERYGFTKSGSPFVKDDIEFVKMELKEPRAVA